MESHGTHIIRSLELVSEMHGDPVQQVYQSLFEARPELEKLFALDHDSSVREEMMHQVYDCIFDHCNSNSMAPSFIASSRTLHMGYGVTTEKFDEFFSVMQATIQKLLGQLWTDQMTQEWNEMRRAFTATC